MDEKIEEMAEIMYQVEAFELETLAEALYNAGYRKIHEGAVVLTREEYDEIKQYQSYIPDLKKAFDKVRKATAEKFAERLKERFNPYYTEGLSEAIDETAKEITEGKV